MEDSIGENDGARRDSPRRSISSSSYFIVDSSSDDSEQGLVDERTRRTAPTAAEVSATVRNNHSTSASGTSKVGKLKNQRMEISRFWRIVQQ